MFSSAILFSGKPAYIIKKYSKSKLNQGDIVDYLVSNGESPGAPADLFVNYYACMYAAAAIGLANNKKCDPPSEAESDPQYKDVTANVWGDVVRAHYDQLTYLYQLMILSDSDLQMTDDERIHKAFSPVTKENEEIETSYFLKFVFGGLKIIDSNFTNCKSFEEIANRLCVLMQECKGIFVSQTQDDN